MENSAFCSHKTLRYTMTFTALFTLLAHGYRYLSLSFSGDAMLLSQTGEELYQISLGRFLQPVYWQIRGYIAAPLLIGLFTAAFMAASSLLVVRLLRIDRPLHIALVCGVLTANETMAISNAAYLPWTDVYALALLLSLFGVFLFFETRRGYLISPLLYMLSLGLYQSYLPAASTMIILLLLFEVLDGSRTGDVWKKGLLACASLLAGLLLYAGILQLILGFTGAQASTDYNGVGNVGAMALSEVPGLLAVTFLTPLRLLFDPSGSPVMTWHDSLVPPALNIALILVLGGLMLLCLGRRLRPAAGLTVAFLLLILPLGMNFIQFVSNGLASGLTIYAYNLLYLLPLALLLRMEKESGSFARRIMPAAKAGVIGCLSLFLLLNVRSSNVMVFKRDLEFSATTAAMSRLLDQAERTQGYVPGETPVVLVGMLPASYTAMERPGFEEVARVQGMRYTYAASYETCNYWYLQMMLGEPVNLVTHEERVRLTQQADVSSIPYFPRPGCCRMIDGVLYIHIS